MSEHIKLQLKHSKNNNPQKQAFAKGIWVKVDQSCPGLVAMYPSAATWRIWFSGKDKHHSSNSCHFHNFRFTEINFLFQLHCYFS